MLTFLRKIRKSLIESLPAREGAAEQAGGSARKYILYAIGEITLVVLGILIALQINNYNDQRKRKIEKDAILAQLQIDLVESRQGLEDAKEFHLERARASAKIAQAFWRNEVSTDTLSRYFGRPLSNQIYSPTLGTARSLISSGNINLINSTTLKNTIISYIEKVDNLLDDIRRYEETYYRSGINLAYEAVPMTFRSIDYYENRRVSSRRQTSLDLGISGTPEKIDKIPFKVEVEDFLSDDRVFRAYRFLNLSHSNVYRRYNEILQLTNELLQQLENVSD